MFPKEFHLQKVAQRGKGCHRAILFRTFQTTEQVVENILNMGVSAFITPDSPDYIDCYKDDRLIGQPSIYTASDCCSFTKTAGYFYLFPFHKDELNNVGLDEQDLIYWINKLNETEVGFDYKYFGEHKSPKITEANQKNDWRHYAFPLPDNKFYWVGVPKLGLNGNKPYLHWVALRYLISTEISSAPKAPLSPKIQRLPYFNIPRITVMLHEEFGVDFLKAFLYAHIANPFKSSNGLCYSDIMGKNFGPGKDYIKSAQGPCVNLTNAQFKVIWDNCGTYMNNMLTQTDFEERTSSKPSVVNAGIKNLHALYTPEICFELFDQKEYQEFINYIENSYKEYEEKVA